MLVYFDELPWYACAQWYFSPLHRRLQLPTSIPYAHNICWCNNFRYLYTIFIQCFVWLMFFVTASCSSTRWTAIYRMWCINMLYTLYIHIDTHTASVKRNIRKTFKSKLITPGHTVVRRVQRAQCYWAWHGMVLKCGEVIALLRTMHCVWGHTDTHQNMTTVRKSNEIKSILILVYYSVP